MVCLGSSCFARGNSENLAIIKQYVQSHGLNASVRLTGRLCQDQCKQGPNLTIGGELHHSVTAGKACANCCSNSASPRGATMERLNAIYTQQRECQDCHKCIRECPVKAIRVQDGYARVVPELCIMCGNCILACPSNAKHVRDDLPSAKALLDKRPQGDRLAGAFVCGAVSRRAAGAVDSCAQEAGILRCFGNCAGRAAGLGQRLRADAQRAEAGLDLVGLPGGRGFHRQVSSGVPAPCLRRSVAPADALQDAARALWQRHRDRLYRALHRQEERGRSSIPNFSMRCSPSRIWTTGWTKKNIHLAEIAETPDDRFRARGGARRARSIPSRAEWFRASTRNGEVSSSQFMSFSGIANVEQALKGISEWKPEHNIFFETDRVRRLLHQRPQGGAQHIGRAPPLRHRPLRQARRRACRASFRWISTSTTRPRPSLATNTARLQLQEALRTVGKYSAEDELNCGGCGYDSCRDFAHALIARNAERMMCATYTRKLAQKKANALLQKMPSAVVIVDEDLKIIECNVNFVRPFRRRCRAVERP